MRTLITIVALTLMSSPGWAKNKTQFKTYRINGVKARVQLGDIAQTPAKFLVTFVNSGGVLAWHGAIDGAIGRVTGAKGFGRPGSYHKKAASLEGQPELTPKVIKKQPGMTNTGAFKHVTFVIDNGAAHLPAVVATGLKASNDATSSKSNAVMGLMRSGVFQAAGGGMEKVTQEHATGIAAYAKAMKGKANVNDVTIVVYSGSDGAKSMAKAMDKALSAVADK